MTATATYPFPKTLQVSMPFSPTATPTSHGDGVTGEPGERVRTLFRSWVLAEHILI